jgi:hypothetical protein
MMPEPAARTSRSCCDSLRFRATFAAVSRYRNTVRSPFDNHCTDPSQGEEVRQEWTHAERSTNSDFRGGVVLREYQCRFAAISV